MSQPASSERPGDPNTKGHPPSDQQPSGEPRSPEISIIILNYNGLPWLERCLESLRAQTIRSQLQIIIADNASTDGSDTLAARLVENEPGAVFMQHGANLGFCEGNNRAVPRASGKYLFFLNNDTWLEPRCLELLLEGVHRLKADAGTPVMLNYDDDSIQSSGGAGFDLFGFMSYERPALSAKPVFVIGGCSYLIRRELFEHLGGFDRAFFMYAEEYDLSWRLWLAGHRGVLVPEARLHHRGPGGSGGAVAGAKPAYRTSDSKRYYSNRNNLLVVWKNAQHLLLLLVPMQVLLLAAEAVVGWVLVRRWSFVRRAYVEALRDCWGMRTHVVAERRRLRALRRRSDFWMLRFFRWVPNRFDLLLQVRRHGNPEVVPH